MMDVMTNRRSRRASLTEAAVLAGLLAAPVESAASPVDQVTDLTGKAHAIITLKGRDNFTSEYQYDVSVRNQTADTLIGDSLIVVLDKITNLAGEEREPLKSETILSRFEVLGQDGETDDGKPFFRIPPGNGPDLAPQTDSKPVFVRIRNKDYVAVFTPSFKVYGNRRPPPETKQQPSQTPHTPIPSQGDKQTEKLIQLLIKKGVISEEEWRKARGHDR
jgi:hypothetical protein